MSQPPPQPPDLPSGPPSFPASPPGLPPGAPPIPPAAAAYPAWLPPPASRSLASRPVFWIVLIIGILAFFAILSAAAFRGYSIIVKGVKEKQAKQEAMAELQQMQKEHQQSMRQELEETGTIGSQSQEQLEKLQQVLEKSGQGTDDDAASSRAAATWTRNIGEASKLYTEASARCDDPPIMDAASLKSKEDLASRRVVVQEFMVANQHLIEVFRNSERDFATYLQSEGVPQGRVPAMAKGFVASLGRQLPVIQKIRDQDAAYAGLLLQWLDLIETEWGSWSVENDALTFSRPEAENTHTKLAADIAQIAVDQAEAQRQLVELQEKVQ